MRVGCRSANTWVHFAKEWVYWFYSSLQARFVDATLSICVDEVYRRPTASAHHKAVNVEPSMPAPETRAQREPAADLGTPCKSVKHPSQRTQKNRTGIEYAFHRVRKSSQPPTSFEVLIKQRRCTCRPKSSCGACTCFCQ